MANSAIVNNFSYPPPPSSVGQVRPTDSPIYKLPAEVLVNIFISNAIMETMAPHDPLYSPDAWSDSPLCTTHRTTQVCHAWRTIALSSGSIWGRLLDLDQLQSKSSHFQYEVLGRSLSAPLYVRGGVGAIEQENDYFNEPRWDSATWQFFSDVLQTHWFRIRSLDIRIYHLDATRDNIWRAFHSPAPCLEYFSLQDAQYLRPSALYFPTLPFFSHNSPLLRSFRGPDCMVLLKNPNGWACQLSEFKLFPSETPLRFTPVTLLDALSEMQALESLWLVHPFRGDTDWASEAVYRPLTLPNLQSLVFEDSAHRAHMFFANLTLPSVFYSDVAIRMTHSELTSDAFNEQCGILRRLAAGFVAHGGHCGKEISIEISPNRFKVSAHFGAESSDRHMRCSHFSFTLYGPVDADTSIMFLTEFTGQRLSPLRAFSNATHLRLHLDFFRSFVPEGFIQKLVHLIHALPFITTLEIGPQAVIASLLRNTGPVFPSLRVVKILGYIYLQPLNRLFAIFDALENSGEGRGLNPIDSDTVTADIQRSGAIASPEDDWHPEDFVDAVGEYSGLEVVYNWEGEMRTYTCGLGNGASVPFLTAQSKKSTALDST